MGTRSSRSSCASTRASCGSPVSVRSPHRTSTSACSSIPCSRRASSPGRPRAQCRSPSAAIRMVADRASHAPGRGNIGPAMQTVTVTERGAARVRSGQPWVWRADVARPPERSAPGAVQVVDGRGRVLGGALWAARSPVALRVYATSSDPPPWTGDLLEARLRAAHARRTAQYAPDVDAFRVAHAEADDLPGLLVD